MITIDKVSMEKLLPTKYYKKRTEHSMENLHVNQCNT